MKRRRRNKKSHGGPKRKASAAGAAADQDYMPTLSTVDPRTGERTSPQDILSELGIEVGTKVKNDSIRGIYTVAEIRMESDKSVTICLELSAKMISMAELWEMLEVTAGKQGQLPEATSTAVEKVSPGTSPAPTVVAGAAS